VEDPKKADVGTIQADLRRVQYTASGLAMSKEFDLNPDPIHKLSKQARMHRIMFVASGPLAISNSWKVPQLIINWVKEL